MRSFMAVRRLVYCLQLDSICAFWATILGGRPKSVFGGGHVRPIF
jgi:hypothetical protein